MNRSGSANAMLLLCLISIAAAGGCEQPPWARSRTFLFGGRIPRSYFLAKASAESDQEGQLGCRDEAWVAAGLGRVNVVPGVFALPVEAEEIPPPERLRPGSMLDAAVAEISGAKGEVLTAAVRIAQVRARKTGRNLGGLIVTYRGHASSEEALAKLDQTLQQAFERRYDPADRELANPKTVIESLTPKKKYGTVVVAVVFADVVWPQTGGPLEFKPLREFIGQ
jgi:pyruvoyl-dependent arginine decarboxylase (PvlArgDC)